MNYIKIKFINQLGKGPKAENVKIMNNFVVWLIELSATLTIINFQLQSGNGSQTAKIDQ